MSYSKFKYTIIFCLLLFAKIFSQNKGKPSEPLVASTMMVFIDGEEKGEYACSLKIEKGRMKVGDKIDALGTDGKKFTFTVMKIAVDDKNVTETGPTSYAFVDLKSNGKAKGFDQGFSLVKSGESMVEKATIESKTNTSNTNISCQIDGKTWIANSGSNLFYKKGIKNMFNGKPYMMLAFVSAQKPDDRQLTMAFFDFAGNLGTFNKEKIEILLSGSANGDKKNPSLQGHKLPSMSTDFAIEITDYKAINKDQAEISGRFSGNLKGTLGAKPCKIENGIFQKVKVVVYNDAY